MIFKNELQACITAVTRINQLIDNEYNHVTKNVSDDSNSDVICLAQSVAKELLTDEEKMYSKLTRGQIISDFAVLISAGMDTTSTTAETGILLLAKYPNIQTQVQ